MHIKILGLSIWAFYYKDRFGWFRLFGRGLKFRDIAKHEPIFSERYGYATYLQIKKWRIGFLK